MTKYILHGGETKVKNKSNSDFFRELVKSRKKNLVVLLVYFAKPKARWKELVGEDIPRVTRLNKNKKINFIVADEKKFADQAKKAGSIYIRGGKDSLLQRKIKKFNLKKLFQGKTVAGSSAGANQLAKYYFSTDALKIRKGLGILPIKTFCHFKNNKKELENLKKYKEDLKIYTIPETKFVVVKI